MGATGSKIWLKIHLRGATEGSESPITAAPWIFRQILLVVEPKIDFHIVKEFSAEGVSLFNIIKYAVKTVLDNPVVRHNLIVNIRLSLLFCGVCIIINMVQSLKQTEKTKVKKSS